MLLEKLKMSDILMLERILEEDNAWQRVAQQFEIDTRIHLKSPSAFNLLNKLIARLVTVEDLHHVLEVLKLEEAAKLICKPEMLRIVRQPYCETEGCSWDENGTLLVKAGQKLHLKIEAEGCPKPHFQWYCENIPVCSEKEYIIPSFSDEEGVYHCIVHQREDYDRINSVISEDINIKLIDVRQEIPQILSFDVPSKELECGDELKISVTVSAGSQPNFSWWHNAKPLEGFNSNVLRIAHVEENCKGTYEFRVKNKFGENREKFEVKVKPRRPRPTEKKALLISNEDYKHKRLLTPHNDAKVLKECLEKYDFECTVKQDLPANSIKEEVMKFLATLQPEAFVLFFFGGHGIMENNLLYMIGSDADLSSQLKLQHVVSENFVIDAVQQYKPLMVASILDMCQGSAKCDFFPKVDSKRWDCTLYRCYSTSQNRSALERNGCKNSLYVKQLQEFLLKEKNLTFNDLISRVNQSVINENPASGQRPEVRIALLHDFKLSDSIRSLK